jgi:hypothetical protein
MFAQASGGNIGTFSTGNAEETVVISSGQHSSIGFELNRNTTITSSSFFIKPTETGSSVGTVDIDANADGVPEWSFNDTGYGDFGHQTLFTTGNTSMSIPINPNQGAVTNPESPPFYLPTGSTVSSSSLEIGFSPSLIGGFFSTGYIHAVDKGDFNNDSNVDFALLSRTANVSTGNTTQPGQSSVAAFRIASYDNATGITLSSWVTTCANATRVMAADVNGDTFDDVVGYAPADDQLCIHFTNTTNGGFEPQVNVTHVSSIIDLAFGDFTGNGLDEMISIQANGKVSVDQFSNRTNAFSNRDYTTVTIAGTANPATLTHMLFAYFAGPQNLPSLIACQSNGAADVMFWSNSTGTIATGSSLSGVSSDAVVGDFDGDQDLDIVASTPNGHRSIENQAGGWDSDTHNRLLTLTNATILDYDLDSASHLLIPNVGTTDGNPATLTGNISAYGFQNGWNYDNRVRSQATEVFEPWTSPRAVHFGDMDGDGSIEQLILAGEGNQHGVFVSAYHRIGYDIDKDGAVDVEAGGYAGNGSNGLAPLMLQDTTGNFTTSLNVLSPGLPYTSDGYGTQMAAVNLSMYSITEGTFTFDNLDIRYVANFLVNSNPSLSGNLSNILNQQMTAGSGNLPIPLHINTSYDGSVVLFSPNLAYVDGAPNIALPPTPALTLVDLQPDRVVIEWQPITEFGDDLLDFVVYRSVMGQPLNLEAPIDNTFSNNTIDTSVQPGQSWTYWVQSVHSFGITSNISAPLSVTVPYPAPKSFLPNLTAMDVPNDEGGVMNISWSAGDESIVEHHVFVLPSTFNDVSNRTTTITAEANATSVEITQDSTGAPLVDGTAYYVAAIGTDMYGNASMNVTAIGPIYTRNDTSLTTTLDVAYTDFTQNELTETVLLARTKGLAVEANLHQAGTAIANATLTLTITDDTDAFTLDMTTDETGHASLTVDALSSLGPIEALGTMSLVVSYAGSEGDEQNQPLLGTTNSQDAYGTVLITITPDEPLPLQSNEQFETLLMVDADDPTQNAYLANLMVPWSATDAEGNETSSGVAEARGNELAVAGQAAYDGRLTVYLSTDPPVYYLPGMMASYVFESSPDNADNETNTTDETNQTTDPVSPDVTLPATVDCGTTTYEWDSNATDVLITCTVTNPNPFEVMVGFAWKVVPGTPPAIELVHNEADGDTSSLTAEANGTVDLTFSLVRNGPTEGMFPGLQGEGYIVSLTCLDLGDNACNTMTEPTASTEGELQWTLGEMPVQVVDDNPILDETEGAMTPVLVGIGVVIALIAGVGGVLYMRNNMEDDFFDDDDDEDYYQEAMDAPETKPGAASVDLGASKSLDELKSSGKELHSAAPEGLAASPALGSSADAFEFGATAEDATPDVDEDEEWHEEEAEADDGITVDENGTEWWEDEEGVWWYREEGWEDWAAWEE